jgi:hypothetical protein
VPDTATTQPPTERERYITLLGALADLMREHPEIPQPYTRGNGQVHFIVFSKDALEIIAVIRRAIGGKWDKKPRENDSGDYYDFIGGWHGFEVEISTYRETVCTRVVTGTREVTEMVKDPAKLAEVPEIEVTRTEDVIEWDCGSLLAPRVAPAALDA